METWLLTVKEKKEAYDTMIIPIGGKTEDKDDTEGGYAIVMPPQFSYDCASCDMQDAERTVTRNPSRTTHFPSQQCAAQSAPSSNSISRPETLTEVDELFFDFNIAHLLDLSVGGLAFRLRCSRFSYC